MEELIHKDLSYAIIGCAFEVYRELGPFYTEPLYQAAMEACLRERGMQFDSQFHVPVMFHSAQIGRRRLDLVVEGKVIVELKAIEQLHKKLYSQVIQYLAAARLELGLLINFGSLKRLEYKRLVLSAAFREHSAPVGGMVLE